MTPLQESILKAVAYFDIFAYPVTVRQIYEGLTTNSVSVDDVGREAENLTQSDRLKRSGVFYYLPSKDADLVPLREEREQYAAVMMKRAERSARLIRRFPFVRGVFLSGELSKNVATKRSDVDFFIVTATGRLWICRTLLILFKKIFLLNRRKYFCLNHFVSEEGLEIKRRSLYVAMEIATLRVLWNTRLFDRFVLSNAWVSAYLPNAHPLKNANPRHPDSNRSPVQGVLEAILEAMPLDWLDDKLMKSMKRYWHRKYHTLPPEKLEEQYQCTRDSSTAYGRDYQRLILDAYSRRVNSLGLAKHD